VGWDGGHGFIFYHLLCLDGFNLSGFRMKKTENINGTSLRGSVSATFQQLIDAFGVPSCWGCDQTTDVEWHVVFDDLVVATIYNWKNGKSYLGSEGLPMCEIKTWNVGGFTDHAIINVKEKLQ